MFSITLKRLMYATTVLIFPIILMAQDGYFYISNVELDSPNCTTNCGAIMDISFTSTVAVYHIGLSIATDPDQNVHIQNIYGGLIDSFNYAYSYGDYYLVCDWWGYTFPGSGGLLTHAIVEIDTISGYVTIGDDLSVSSQSETFEFLIGDPFYLVIIEGCMDPIAVNYDLNVNTDDGSCVYLEDIEPHFSANWSGIPYNPMGFYIPSATIDGIDLRVGDEIAIFDENVCVGHAQLESEIVPNLQIFASQDNPGTEEQDGFINGNEIIYRFWDASDQTELINVIASVSSGSEVFQSLGFSNTSLSVELIPGCTEPSAINYNPEATTDDGSCIYPIYGCMEESACNYNPEANTDDGTCLYYDCAGDCGGSAYLDDCSVCDDNPENNNECIGCTDIWALNYDQFYTIDDGFCEYPGLGDIITDGSLDVLDVVALVAHVLNEDEFIFFLDFNYDGYINIIDIVMMVDIILNPWLLGCTDPSAGNYNPEATFDDGSCIYAGKSFKRGLAFDLLDPADFQAIQDGVSWWYNWYYETEAQGSYHAEYAMDFIPMLWGGSPSQTQINGVKSFILSHPEIEYLLVMNEPNLVDQANRTPTQAAGDWPVYEQVIQDLADQGRTVYLVGPAMNWGTMSGYADPIDWLDDFYTAYRQANGGTDPQIDYLAFHWYDYGLESQLNRLMQYGKDFWITEMANWNANINSYEDQIAQMTEMVALCENRTDVFRYAWFYGRGGFPDNHFTYLFGPNAGELTILGEAYLSLPYVYSQTR